jgi:hypothetical protein
MNEPKPKSNSATMIIIVVLVAGVLLVLPCVIAVGLLGGAGFLFMRAADSKEMRAMDANMPTMAVPTAVDEAMRIEPPTLDSPPVEPTVEQPTEPPTAEQP